MASLSDQIDRLTRNTRSIKATASQVSPPSSQVLFTRAVLSTHLGDLIRDVDPSELGLFRLQNGTSGAYDKDGRPGHEPAIKRTEFTGATPLRRHAARREGKQDIEPEVYANAALKYIDQYEPIRPMPRAYDQIVTVLNRLNEVRANIESLNATLEQASVTDKVPPTKVRMEQEEQRIRALQARVAELSKRKENATKTRKPTANQEQPESNKDTPQVPSSPCSPQEEKFWATPGGPSRVLRFSENLLDEEVNLGDVSAASFGSPSASPSEVRPLKLFGESDVLDEEPTVMQFEPSSENQPQSEEVKIVHDVATKLNLDIGQPSFPKTPSTPPLITSVSGTSDSEKVFNTATETPTATRQRKIKVNIEVERIVSKIWTTVGDIIIPPGRTTTTAPLSVGETLAHLQQLAAQSPQPESPTASTVSSMSGEGNSLPTFQQIQIAYLLTTLLSASPHYSMPLNQVKENLALKAKGSGIAAAGQGTTRVLFQCVAKRLVKIDRGGREQIVKFDI